MEIVNPEIAINNMPLSRVDPIDENNSTLNFLNISQPDSLNLEESDTKTTPNFDHLRNLTD